MSETHNTFGAKIRGLRLGFYWSKAHECFIRIKEHGEAKFLIEMAPSADAMPQKSSGKHIVWTDRPELLDMCEPLREWLTAPFFANRYGAFIVDDNGRRIYA